MKTGNQSINQCKFSECKMVTQMLRSFIMFRITCVTYDDDNEGDDEHVCCVPPAFTLVLSEHVKVRGQRPEAGSLPTRALGIDHDIRLLAAPLSNIAGLIATPIS